MDTTTLYFDTIHIVEWLRTADRRTGLELSLGIEPIGVSSNPPVSVSYSPISTRRELTGFLRSLAADVRKRGRSSVLHLETHGSSDGIGVSQEEHLLWPQLMEEFVPLNSATRLNLFVLLAACEGIWGIQMLQPAGRAAFRAMIGPNHPIGEDEILKAHLKFYQTLFQDRSAVTAFRAMNNSAVGPSPTFGVVTAESTFRIVFREYMKELCNEETLLARENKIVEECVAKEKRERGLGTSADELANARLLARNYLRDHGRHFDERRKEFFFIDLYPENDLRFNLTLEECMTAHD